MISKEQYDQQISKLNPSSANGPKTEFIDTFKEMINLIKGINKGAKILISAILPRMWDFDRRNLVRIEYNNILKKVAQEEEIYFIQSYSPFFDRNKNLKEDLFCNDGLHLSPAGTRVFKTFICDKIDRAIKNKLV